MLSWVMTDPITQTTFGNLILNLYQIINTALYEDHKNGPIMLK